MNDENTKVVDEKVAEDKKQKKEIYGYTTK